MEIPKQKQKKFVKRKIFFYWLCIHIYTLLNVKSYIYVHLHEDQPKTVHSRRQYQRSILMRYTEISGERHRERVRVESDGEGRWVLYLREGSKDLRIEGSK